MLQVIVQKDGYPYRKRPIFIRQERGCIVLKKKYFHILTHHVIMEVVAEE